MAVTAASCGSEEMVLGHPQAEHRPQTAEQSSSRGRSRDWALNTPRGTRASLLREKASADVRLELERIESSVASPVAKELSWVYSTGTARARRRQRPASATRERYGLVDGPDGNIQRMRFQLAEREVAIENLTLKLESQGAALEATRLMMQTKVKEVQELQDSARRAQHQLLQAQGRFESQATASKKERDLLQNRVHCLQREKEDEKKLRLDAQEKLARSREELMATQQAREAEQRDAEKKMKKMCRLESALSSAKTVKERMDREMADLQDRIHKLEMKDHLVINDSTLQTARVRFLDSEQTKRAETFAGRVESLWRNADLIAIIHGMQLYIRHDGAVQRAFQALTSLAHEDSHVQIDIAAAGGIGITCEAMKIHSKNSQLQHLACALLLELAFNNENQVLIADSGGIFVILAAMDTHVANSHVQHFACRALCRLAWWRTNLQERIKAEGAVDRVQRAMEQPNVEGATVTWGKLLLARLLQTRKSDMLPIELDEMAAQLDAQQMSSLKRLETEAGAWVDGLTVIDGL